MPPQVLILGYDSASTGAVWAAAEASGWEPMLSLPEESADNAADRLHPAYVLVDVRHAAATSTLLYATVSRLRARVVLYGTDASTLIMRRLAVRFGVATIETPFDSPNFTSAFENRLDAEEWLAGWLCPRRMGGVFAPAIDCGSPLTS